MTFLLLNQVLPTIAMHVFSAPCHTGLPFQESKSGNLANNIFKIYVLIDYNYNRDVLKLIVE
jgi:hypothetical protein